MHHFFDHLYIVLQITNIFFDHLLEVLLLTEYFAGLLQTLFHVENTEIQFKFPPYVKSDHYAYILCVREHIVDRNKFVIAFEISQARHAGGTLLLGVRVFLGDQSLRPNYDYSAVPRIRHR